MRFILPIIAHFLGDFILQSSTMVSNKKTRVPFFVFHCLIYSALMILSLMWFSPVKNAIYVALIIIISHTVIDYIKIILLNRLSKMSGDHKTFEFTLFIVDQVLHILIIVCTVHLLYSTNSVGKVLMSYLLLHFSSQRLYNMAIIAFLYIICLSPAAVLIKKVFILFSFQNNEDLSTKEDIIKSGYLIGVLERVIILTLGLNGQIDAIGFVLAAKSLARFNQLNDKSFAEKYLVGTLLSVAIALFCVVIGNSTIKNL